MTSFLIHLTIASFICLMVPKSFASTLSIAAASSLYPVIDQLTQAYSKKTGIKIDVSYGSSSALARQVYQGAPFALFISAHPKWIDYLQQKQAIDSQYVATVATNRLVLVSHISSLPANTPRYARLDDALAHVKNKAVAVADPFAVPQGDYAKQSLQHTGQWLTLMPQFIFTRNARATLALLQTKEVEFGITYLSDLKQLPSLVPLHVFVVESHDAIVYQSTTTPLANSVALDFQNYLLSSEAQTEFKRLGFMTKDEL